MSINANGTDLSCFPLISLELSSLGPGVLQLGIRFGSPLDCPRFNPVRSISHYGLRHYVWHGFFLGSHSIIENSAAPQCDQNPNSQNGKPSSFFGVEGCGYTAWLSWLSGMDNVEPSVNTTRGSCQSQASGLLHQDAALIAGKVISLQTQSLVCGL